MPLPLHPNGESNYAGQAASLTTMSRRPPQLVPEVEPYPEHASTEVSQQIRDNTVICFGMVGLPLLYTILFTYHRQIVDRPLNAPSHAAAVAPCIEGAAIFTPPREVRNCSTGDVVGRLDNYAGEVLSKITADGELALQLTISASPVVAESDIKTPKGAVGFARIILYGPRNRFSDVGDFMTKCGYYLEDPCGCDRNVPYMNPQCLFSVHEQPPMTFDVPPLQQNNLDDFIPTPCDILAEFETTDRIEEAAIPTALCTTLKPYVASTSTYVLLTPTSSTRHQRQALTFFLRRERGLHPSTDDIGIWSRQPTTNNELVYDCAKFRRSAHILISPHLPGLSTLSRIVHSRRSHLFGEADFLQMRWASVRL
jgi:hypothetical protein